MVGSHAPGHHFAVQIVPQIPGVAAKEVASTPIVRIYSDQGQEARAHFLVDTGEVYALYAELEQGISTIFLDQARMGDFLGNRFFYNFMALERHLIKDQQMILHSCFVLYQGEAILFTAPSGTGKSTQGDLWAKYRGAEVINGDRSLIRYGDAVGSNNDDNACENQISGNSVSRWLACGIPFSGTSGICKNVTVPIKAIVYLHQAPENRIVPLKGRRAFSLLYNQITVNHWNTEFTDTVCSMLDHLIAEVPLYELYCTPDEEAVKCLEKCFNQ
ncbi:MAG: hypothetical protein Q4E53_13270 [Eubacteriales bacterium]|nr:hypothetical protein [Eubacteriales bacterium]